jgi:hypothetical protein
MESLRQVCASQLCLRQYLLPATGSPGRATDVLVVVSTGRCNTSCGLVSPTTSLGCVLKRVNRATLHKTLHSTHLSNIPHEIGLRHLQAQRSTALPPQQTRGLKLPLCGALSFYALVRVAGATPEATVPGVPSLSMNCD